MKRLALFVTLSVIAGTSDRAIADEVKIYESLDDVSIGRVFFTKAQREQLDRLRGSTRSMVTASDNEGGSSNDSVSKDEANGFILSSSGKARVYRNGDFVIVNASPDVDFHDEVTVTRKPDDSDDDVPD